MKRSKSIIISAAFVAGMLAGCHEEKKKDPHEGEWADTTPAHPSSSSFIYFFPNHSSGYYAYYNRSSHRVVSGYRASPFISARPSISTRGFGSTARAMSSSSGG